MSVLITEGQSRNHGPDYADSVALTYRNESMARIAAGVPGHRKPSGEIVDFKYEADRQEPSFVPSSDSLSTVFCIGPGIFVGADEP